MTNPRMDVVKRLLESYRQELQQAVSEVPGDQRDAGTAEGRWSVAQILEHLAETERSITRLIGSLVERAPARPEDDAFDASAFAEDIDMPFFLDRSNRLQGRQPPGELNSAEGWAALEESREAFLEILDDAHSAQLEAVTYDHPATGQALNGWQWIAFVGLHEGRHAKQIREAIR